MGVAIKDLLKKKEIETKDLKGKVLVFDGFNILYQFLTTIRSPDGTPLTNAKGNVTSHLVGLLSRMTKLIEAEIKPIFVFDGETPDLKKKERERRKALKEEAEAKYKIAVKEEDVASMKKYGARTTTLTKQMLDDAEKLLTLLGIPVFHAPSEGEAQAAYMVKKGDAYACVSQDYDSLLFGCPLVIHNLTIAGKRRKIHGIGMKTVKPEIISHAETLNELGIDQDGLIVLGILIGTDFNIGGIKGIGPKNAIKKVKEYQGKYDELFEDLKWSEFFDVSWKEVFNTFKKMRTTDNYKIEWRQIDKEKIKHFLIDELDFSEERVQNSLEKLKKEEKKKTQKGLGDFM